MSEEEATNGLKVGQVAPDFELDTYDPTEHYFGKISLDQQKKDGKWTVLFFYPAADHPRIRARRGGPRPRHYSRQHQPS